MVSRYQETTDSHNPLLVIIPCYKNPHLIKGLMEGLDNCLDELKELQLESGKVMFINDSPEDKQLDLELQKAKERLDKFSIHCEIYKNKKNIGFISSVNVGLSIASDQKLDVLLLNSDTKLYPGCVKELHNVAYIDPMFGFVSPRSNNGGICTIPHRLSNASVSDSYNSYCTIRSWLPRFHVTPTAVGFCLFIKHKIIYNFGLLDESYGRGYNEENDYIMRANSCGYRSCLANYAYCWHAGSESFGKDEYSKLDTINRTILDSRYPEYSKIVDAYYRSPINQAEDTLSGLLIGLSDNKRHIALDFANIGPYYNGTSEMAINIARSIYKNFSDDIVLHFIANSATASFHKLMEIGYVDDPNSDRRYSAIISMGQPFNWDVIRRVARKAPVNGFFMLDTIAQDCGYLYNEEVDNIWRFIAQHADIIYYISDYSRKIFSHRYEIGQETVEKVCLLSTDPCDYAKTKLRDSKHILIVGNHYKHKAIEETVVAISSAFPATNIIVIGNNSNRLFSNVTFIKSGEIPESIIEKYYADAKFVVFPSHYEGFGIPMVKAVAYNKMVYVRQSDLVDEIMDVLPNSHLVKKFLSVKDLVQLIRDNENKTEYKESNKSTNSVSWDHVAYCFYSSINDILAHPNNGRQLRKRISDLQLVNNQTCEELKREIECMIQSRSWKVTKPLRFLMHKIKKI